MNTLNMHSLEDLPPELILFISSFLPPSSSLALSCTCKKIHQTLSETPSFWRGVCRDLDLLGEEWNGEKEQQSTLAGLKRRFLRGKQAETGLRDNVALKAQRIYFDINSLRSKKFPVIRNQRVQRWPEDAEKWYRGLQ